MSWRSGSYSCHLHMENDDDYGYDDDGILIFSYLLLLRIKWTC